MAETDSLTIDKAKSDAYRQVIMGLTRALFFISSLVCAGAQSDLCGEETMVSPEQIKLSITQRAGVVLQQ